MKNSILSALLAVSALAFALPAAAQAPTKAAAAAQGAAPKAAEPAAAPAPAPVVVTPEARTAIKEFMDTTNTRDNLTKSFQMMSQTLPAQMGQAIGRGIDANPSLSMEQKQKALESMRQPYENAVKEAMTIVNDPKLIDEAMEKMYPIYAKYYTPAELKQITAFYKTPVGAKMLSVMPQVLNESMMAGLQLVQPRLTALVDKTLKSSPVAAPAAAAPAPAKAAPKKQ